MIDKVEFTAKNLTSNAGVLLLLNYTEEPENISRFLYNFNFKTTQMARDINFRTFKKLLKKKKLRKIVIDLDSRAVNVEGNQEGAVKGYHPQHKGNNCYNILMAFCDELKALCVLEMHISLMVLPKG